MSVADHLQIDLAEYDARIRTFIPNYEAMIAAAAASLRGDERLIVDLGIGTGALSERCLRVARQARIVGVDEDAGMLEAARARLGRRARLVCGSFFTAAIPSCDAIVASLALHHVRTRTAKRRLYARLRRSLKRGGLLVSADCHPSSDRRRDRQHRDDWLAFLRKSYGTAQARRYMELWAKEDVYVPLAAELSLLDDAGYAPEVAWRQGPFAVIAAAARG